MTSHITRRQLLAGVGTASVVGLTGFGLGRRSPRFVNYTYALPDGPAAQAGGPPNGAGPRLRVAWYEAVNGQFRESQGGTTPTTAAAATDVDTGPSYVDAFPSGVVSEQVVPGDSGVLVIGLAAEIQDLVVRFRPRITADAENGQTEPERKAEGPDTDGDGELDSVLTARFWVDGGLLGLNPCDGTLGIGESPLSVDGADADGSFRVAFDTVNNDDEGVVLFDCIPEGERRCLALAWEFPATNGNVGQSDELAFELEFTCELCTPNGGPA